MARKTAETTERKKPERMGGFGDQRLAEALTLRLVKLVTPIQSRPQFRDVRALLFRAVASLQAIQEDSPAESE